MGSQPAILGGPPAFKEQVFITRPAVPDRAQFQRRVDGIFESRCLTNDGPLVRELERRLQEWLQTDFCACFCNGTVALEIALRALDLEGEVITTPFTFPATCHAVAWNGLTPVFCDVDPLTYNLDVRRVADLVTDRTAAILPVHVFGNPCDVVEIERLANAKGLKVIYDAAHAFGVRHRGRSIGMWGDLSMLSFHATKLFHTGEGGALVGPRRAAVDRIRLLRNFGIVNQNEVRGVGLNGKLSELHAAVGLGVLELVADEVSHRGAIAARYHSALAGVEGLLFQQLADDTDQNHAYFTIAVDAGRFGLTRDELHQALLAENVVTRKYFYPLCSENECYRELPSARPGNLPHAHELASRILCLPIYGTLSLENVDRIAERVIAIRANADRVRPALAGRNPGQPT